MKRLEEICCLFCHLRTVRRKEANCRLEGYKCDVNVLKNWDAGINEKLPTNSIALGREHSCDSNQLKLEGHGQVSEIAGAFAWKGADCQKLLVRIVGPRCLLGIGKEFTTTNNYGVKKLKKPDCYSKMVTTTEAVLLETLRLNMGYWGIGQHRDWQPLLLCFLS